MATYSAFDITISGGIADGAAITVTAADDAGFTVSDESTTDVIGGNEVLGASSPTDTGGGSGYAGFANLIYTSAGYTTGTNGADEADQGNDLQYIGTATVNGVEGFVVQEMTFGNPDTATGNYMFIALDPASAGISTGDTGTIDYLASQSVNINGHDGDWNLTLNQPDTSCFYRDTQIATPDGAVAVQDLKAGDVVMTASGATATVRWLGRSRVSRVFADPMRVLPVRVKAGALGENLPSRDLLLTAGHAVVLGDLLVHAGALVNGTSVVRDSSVPMVFSYYHVELDSHDVLIADGMPVESFLDGAEAMNFDNLADRPAREEIVQELPMARVKSARQLPADIRAMLAERARLLTGDMAVAA